VRLAEWRKQKGWTQTDLAAKVGSTQPYVSAMERARNPAIPGPALMIEIYLVTGGAVQPNDFYDLPALSERKAA
jgi:transcriptional regulator with XRE-family HTH domain